MDKMDDGVNTNKFDISFAVTCSYIYKRYRNIRAERQKGKTATRMDMAVVEHWTALQRLAEGLTAFETTGVSEELLWLTRPAYTIFASQCLLQFGHVQHHFERRGMTSEERAEAYHLHALTCERRLLQKHATWSNYCSHAEERHSRIGEISISLKQKGLNWCDGEEWHKLGLRQAFNRARKKLPDDLRKLLDAGNRDYGMTITIANDGIHGGSFMRRFMHRQSESGIVTLEDRRDVPSVLFAGIAMTLAYVSMMCVARYFDEVDVLEDLFEQCSTDPNLQQTLHVEHFPTALIGAAPF